MNSHIVPYAGSGNEYPAKATKMLLQGCSEILLKSNTGFPTEKLSVGRGYTPKLIYGRKLIDMHCDVREMKTFTKNIVNPSVILGYVFHPKVNETDCVRVRTEHNPQNSPISHWRGTTIGEFGSSYGLHL